MADKRISQLVERTDIANNDVLPIVASGATTTNKVTISTLQDWMQDNLDVGVTSVGLSVPSAFTVSGSPVTTSGNITISGAGTTAQYIRGDGSLADFPSSLGGGGASVSYYLNGSVNQGTIGGVAYRELSKSPILGAGTDFTINADGYIASFITDAGDPSLLEIPGGNWNFETYFQASSGGGTPTFYVELYKVSSGGTATLIATSSGSPELIAFGTNTTPYFSSLAVPTTTLALTDRLAIRYYVAHSGRTITLHTENNTLCQIITTFTTGLTALNGLTAQVQNFATGTSGTDFNISSASTTHTFNLPDASASNRGVVTTGSQVFGGVKTFSNGLSLSAVGGSNQVTRLVNIGTLHEGSATLNQIGFNSANNIYFGKGLSNGGVLQWTNSAVRYYTLPDADGTLALASQLGAYLPLAGGTLTGALGGTSLNFSGDIQTATRLISATGGQQILINANNGGSTNRVESVGTLPLALVSAAAITLAAGGTTPQITLATTGNLGVNNSSPAERLVVGGAIMSTGGITGHGANRTTISQEGSSGAFWQSYGANSSTVGTFVLRQASSDFSITRTPLSIDTTGAATFSSSVTANRLTASNSTDLLLNLERTAVGAWGFNVTSGGNLFLNNRFGTNVFHIADLGNVGIGTASPVSKLSVDGDIKLQSSTATAKSILFSSPASNWGPQDSSIKFTPADGTNAATSLSFNLWDGLTNTTERMRITSGGNVLIGTATDNAGGQKLQVNGSVLVDAFSSGNETGIFFRSGAASSFKYNLSILAFDNDAGGSPDGLSINGFDGVSICTGSNTRQERMRITSGGAFKASNSGDYLNSTAAYHELRQGTTDTNIAIFTNTAASPYGPLFRFTGATPNNAVNYFISCDDSSGSDRFVVLSNGGIKNYAANNVILSDARLKKEIEPLESYWDKFKAIEIVKYKYIDQTHDDFNIGVIAQQVESIAPEFVDVDGWDTNPKLDEEGNEIVSEEEPIKSIYASDLHHATIKVLQEAMEKIEELQIQIDSLKNQMQTK
jgi:hypothetical protein